MFIPILPRDITYLDLFIFYCCFLYLLKIKVWWSNQVSNFYTHTQGFSLNHVTLLKVLSSSLFCSSSRAFVLSILTDLWNRVGIKIINKYRFILVTYLWIILEIINIVSLGVNIIQYLEITKWWHMSLSCCVTLDKLISLSYFFFCCAK